MRESIGATWILSIVITFIVIFVGYLAVSINYTKAFRIKNTIITKIENSEGISDENMSEIENDIRKQLVYENYTTVGKCSEVPDGWEKALYVNSSGNDDNARALACIYKREGHSNIENCPKVYYKIKVFFKIDVPVLGDLFTLGVNGDTRGIYDRANHEDCITET